MHKDSQKKARARASEETNNQNDPGRAGAARFGLSDQESAKATPHPLCNWVSWRLKDTVPIHLDNHVPFIDTSVEKLGRV